MLCPSLQAAVVMAGLLLVLDPAQGQEKALPQPTEQAEIVHVLNRITFGLRPGDVEAVQKMGLNNYIEQQLHPETIDDSAVDQEVQKFELLQMTPQELATVFQEDTKKFLKKAEEQKQQAAATPSPGGVIQPMTPPPMPQVANKETLLDQVKSFHSIAAIGQMEQAKLVRATDSNRQLQEVLVDFWTNHFNIDMKKGPCRVLKIVDDRDVIRPHILGKFRDMLEASAKSPAMLFYLDNAENSISRTMSPLEQQMQANFMEKNLGVAPPSIVPGKKQGGINENYAREIMELHTLGVDGGYTQADVQEVARCFTGWTLNRQTGEFVFTPRRHDNGEKHVLGHTIPANGGIKDGEMVLDILAAHPSTAHFISRELCQRFVSDDPPESLVTRVAAVFQKTDGDLRQVVKAILTSPEFLSPASFQTKIKSPLEFAVSAARATESTLVAQDPPPFDKLKPITEGSAVLGREKAADRLNARKQQSLNWHVYKLGEPLFACTPPTGYKEVSKNWVSPGALIERLNFALALTQQEVEDVRFNSKALLSQTDLDKPDDVLNQCVAELLHGNISPETQKVLNEAALPPPGTGGTVAPGKLIALILGSPEFQRK